eukprot:4074142-Pyramimonas_sp.AAC.2
MAIGIVEEAPKSRPTCMHNVPKRFPSDPRRTLASYPSPFRPNRANDRAVDGTTHLSSNPPLTCRGA